MCVRLGFADVVSVFKRYLSQFGVLPIIAVGLRGDYPSHWWLQANLFCTAYWSEGNTFDKKKEAWRCNQNGTKSAFLKNKR